MISFILPEDQFFAFDTHDAANQFIQAHAEFVDRTLHEALIRLHGEMPSHEDIQKHCSCVIDKDNLAHYIWYANLDEKPKAGEQVDLSAAFCVIAPPKFYTKED